MQHRGVGIWTKLFYGFGSVAFGVKDNGFGFFLLLYYNQVLGLPEQWVGIAIMVALIADAFFDPLVGYLSDHLHSRWGRRHPFMYGAALPVAASYYFLWNPPGGLSHVQLFIYLAVMAILVRVLIACYEIPSTSLVAELTDHYDERTSILGYRFFFGWWGGLTVTALAYAVFLVPDASHPTGVLNPNGYHRYGSTAAVIMAIAIVISAMGTHSRIPYLRKPPPKNPLGLLGALSEFTQTLANRSFLALFTFAIFASMAVGITATLSIYFNTYFWELSSQQMLALAMLNFVSAAVAVMVTPRLSLRYGKKTAAIATAVVVVSLGPLPVVLRLLNWFPANGSPWLLPILCFANTILVTLFIIASILVSSMLADIVEDNEVGTGKRSEGVFFAANAFVQKSVTGVGIYSSTLLLAIAGFPAGAKPGEVAPEIVRQLGLIYIPTLMVLWVASLIFLSMYRISRASHQANLERLGRGDTALSEPRARAVS